jgi:predicted alpha/beta-hydrolase family hydrolase
MLRRPLLASLSLIMTSSAAFSDPVTRLPRSHGEPLEVIADMPAGPGPFPAIVLAPGQGYPMDGALLAETARRLAEDGVAVWRFNWAYWTKDRSKGAPSEDLALEVREMAEVVAAARADRRVDPARLFVGGKSLGSLVAWQLLRQDAALHGALLLTPICTDERDGKPVAVGPEGYAGLATERRPLAFIAGDEDPSCTPSMLYAFAAGTAGSTRVAIVGGDHGLRQTRLAKEMQAKALARTVDDAARLAASFVLDAAAR